MSTAVKLSAMVAVLCLAALCHAQEEVEVAPVKGGVVLIVSAQKSYQLMPGETKLPSFMVECLHKGKHGAGSHLVLFSPGGAVANDSGALGAQSEHAFVMTVNGKKRATAWVSYGDTDTFAYAAKSDEERMQFLQSLLGSTVSIQFKPFLTGTPTTATFDLTKMRDALEHQSECSGQ